MSYLPMMVVLVPIIGSIAVYYAARYGERYRSIATGTVSSLTLALAVWQFVLVQQGHTLACGVEECLGVGLRWKVDFVSAFFSVVVAAVWFLATVFAREYMAHEHSQTRFFSDSIFTLGSTLGVFVAGDLFTLFLFFELMTFAAYMLVIHEQDRDSMSAGNVYLYMSVAGGLILLAAIFILQYVAGHTRFESALQALITHGISPWLVLAMVIGGFGVKAGLIPLHIWLPRAHPVAPAPASALLSALMIKTGAYGFFRFLYVFLSVPESDTLFAYQQSFGYLFIWIGAITMFAGAIMGILNNSMKKILAYSSISQMGYILFGMGTGAFLGSRGAAALAGSWLHAVNHAFFKSFLFLLAGAIILHTGELDLNRLGGLRKRMPWTFGFFLVAAAAITGVPGFNGYVSKTLIHEAIVEAYHLHGWSSLIWLERIFTVTGGLTAAYITKIWAKTFLQKPRQNWDGVQDISMRHRIVFGVYSIIILLIGTQAQGVVNRLAIPVVSSFSFNLHDVEHLHHVPYWTGHALSSVLVSYAIAGLVLAVVWKYADRITLPKWMSVEYLFYKPVYRAAIRMVEGFSIWKVGGKQVGTVNVEPSADTQAQVVQKGEPVGDSFAIAVVVAVVLIVFLLFS